MNASMLDYVRMLLAIATIVVALWSVRMQIGRPANKIVHPSLVLMLSLLALSSVATIISYFYRFTTSISGVVWASVIATFFIVLAIVRIYWRTWGIAVDSRKSGDAAA